jgi:hypothetical protein
MGGGAAPAPVPPNQSQPRATAPPMPPSTGILTPISSLICSIITIFWTDTV